MDIYYNDVIRYFSRQLQVDSGDFNNSALEEKPEAELVDTPAKIKQKL